MNLVAALSFLPICLHPQERPSLTRRLFLRDRQGPSEAVRTGGGDRPRSAGRLAEAAAARTAEAAISGRRHGAIAICGSGGGVIDLVMRLFFVFCIAKRRQVG